jgi:hypothetical protein
MKWQLCPICNKQNWHSTECDDCKDRYATRKWTKKWLGVFLAIQFLVVMAIFASGCAHTRTQLWMCPDGQTVKVKEFVNKNKYLSRVVTRNRAAAKCKTNQRR